VIYYVWAVDEAASRNVSDPRMSDTSQVDFDDGPEDYDVRDENDEELSLPVDDAELKCLWMAS